MTKNYYIWYHFKSIDLQKADELANKRKISSQIRVRLFKSEL